MTAPAAFPVHSRRAPWVLWTTLLAMLLALQASAGAIRPAALLDSGAAAAKLTLPDPLVPQFRDTGNALKVAGQRLNAARPHDNRDGTAPPLPPPTPAFVTPTVLGDVGHIDGASAARRDSSANSYRARAPPLPA